MTPDAGTSLFFLNTVPVITRIETSLGGTGVKSSMVSPLTSLFGIETVIPSIPASSTTGAVYVTVYSPNLLPFSTMPTVPLPEVETSRSSSRPPTPLPEASITITVIRAVCPLESVIRSAISVIFAGGPALTVIMTGPDETPAFFAVATSLISPTILEGV